MIKGKYKEGTWKEYNTDVYGGKHLYTYYSCIYSAWRQGFSG